MSNAILLPILIPFFGAALCLLARRNFPLQRVLTGVFTNALPFVCFWLLLMVQRDGVLLLRLGSWPESFGIVLIVDIFSALMLLAASITQAAAWWFVAASWKPVDRDVHLLNPLFLLLGSGVAWALCTGDLFNLFVSFEIILLASYALIAHGNKKPQIREATKFVVLNIIASTIFLAAAAFTYGMFGTLNMADLAVRLEQLGHPPEAMILGTLYFIVFAMKAAMFPLFFWLPHAYPQAPLGVLAYFAGVLTKIGIYGMYRVFTLIFRGPEMMETWFQPLILILSGLTMIIGVLCALAQMTMRRILSFHIISQIGYMSFGLGIFTVMGLAAGIFFVIHQIFVKAALFLVADAVRVNEGTDELEKVKGLMYAYPGMAVLFLFAIFSLAGLPPLSGFFGKYGLVMEGIREGHIAVTVVALLTSIFTLQSMVKIWRYSFWRERPAEAPTYAKNRGVIRATAGLVAVTILVAIFSGWLMGLSIEAAEAMLDRTEYVGAVLGEKGVAALAGSAQEVAQP